MEINDGDPNKKNEDYFIAEKYSFVTNFFYDYGPSSFDLDLNITIDTLEKKYLELKKSMKRNIQMK